MSDVSKHNNVVFFCTCILCLRGEAMEAYGCRCVSVGVSFCKPVVCISLQPLTV